MESETKKTPYAPRTILLTGIGLAIVSFIFSLSMFWLQASEPTDHITGKVVSVESNAIVIMSARGNVTTLHITPNTKIGDIGPLTNLATGTPVMALGIFTNKDTFVVDAIRRFQKHQQ
jgi:hypothetical protein